MPRACNRREGEPVLFGRSGTKGKRRGRGESGNKQSKGWDLFFLGIGFMFVAIRERDERKRKGFLVSLAAAERCVRFSVGPQTLAGGKGGNSMVMYKGRYDIPCVLR